MWEEMAWRWHGERGADRCQALTEPFVSGLLPNLICLMGPYLPKMSYISSEVILKGRLLEGAVLEGEEEGKKEGEKLVHLKMGGTAASVSQQAQEISNSRAGLCRRLEQLKGARVAQHTG